ncbi:tyrosine-protein kinase family protein [Burkholderia sp. LMG 32019]|uniref:tyrosine-protein kinase family protein n=1 Tax=Burkholderia sp. LMG 32019 TaxID=3158173 RepID=UPI003C2E03A1
MVMFDDVLEIAKAALLEKFGEHVPETYIVRDTTGAIVVILPDTSLRDDEWDPLAQKLHENLEQYSPGLRRVLLKQSDLIDADDVIKSPDKVGALGMAGVYLIDRLVTNQDWLREPLTLTPPIPTAVAFSVKGGVGRSTALAMFAWYLSRQGKRVLVIDLDLEAPGIGSMLSSELPKFGLIDWLTEDLNGRGDRALLEQCVSRCPIDMDTDGIISVIPAYGQSTNNYISKLGRVYMPAVDEAGEMVGLADRLARLLTVGASLDFAPDVILLDARAGLHDIGSAAVTRLGAEALFFARNDAQNWWAYGQLFDHLRKAKSVQQGMGNDDDLRWRLKMIGAQTEPREDARRAWVQASYDIWNRFYDDETAGRNGDFEPQVFDRFSAEAPHYPLFVNFDPAVRSLSLTSPNAKPDWAFIQGVFGEFFDGVRARLWPTSTENLQE